MGTLWQFFGFPDPEVPDPEAMKPKKKKAKKTEAPGQQLTIVSPDKEQVAPCLLYTSPSPRDATLSRMPSSA